MRRLGALDKHIFHGDEDCDEGEGEDVDEGVGHAL